MPVPHYLVHNDFARKFTDNGQYSFDYLYGRVMKIDIRGDVLDPGLYDRDNGPDAAMRALVAAGLM